MLRRMWKPADALSLTATQRADLDALVRSGKTPQRVALGLAGGLLALGAWLAFGGRTRRDESRQALIARRDTLLGQLAQIESKRRSGAADADAQARRRGGANGPFPGGASPWVLGNLAGWLPEPFLNRKLLANSAPRTAP